MANYSSKYGQEINDSLNSRLKKLEQAAALAVTFIPKDATQPAPSLEVMIQKTTDKPDCLEMFQELAEEQPAASLKPQTVLTLLQRKIDELRKAVAAMAEASY